VRQRARKVDGHLADDGALELERALVRAQDDEVDLVHTIDRDVSEFERPELAAHERSRSGSCKKV